MAMRNSLGMEKTAKDDGKNCENNMNKEQYILKSIY